MPVRKSQISPMMETIHLAVAPERESYFLLSGISLIWGLVIWLFEPAYMIFSFDDSFYYLKVASNIVSGYGATFDRLNPTNGFHPLWLIVTSAFTGLLGNDARLLMRALLTLQVVMVYAGVQLIAEGTPLQGRTVRIATAVLLTNFYCVKIVVNGQESALQYLLMCISLHYWWHLRESANGRNSKHQLLLGLIFGLTILARIDAVAFVAVLIAMPLLWPDETEAPQLSKRLKDSVSRFVSSLLVVAPYFYWNMKVHGHILPVSAAVKLDWRPSLSTTPDIAVLAVIFFLLTLYWQLAKRARHKEILNQGACFTFPILTYAAAETAASMWMSRAFVPPLWYMPPYLLLLIAVTTIILRICNLRLVYSAITCLTILYVTVTAGLTLHRFDSRSYSFLLAYRDAGRWLDLHAPSDALVGSWDAGIMAAHSNLRFINLDGLINSWDYKINYLDKALTAEFINEVHKVDYICQRFVPTELRTPTYRGVNLSQFYVAWFRCVEHHQMINFLRKGVDGHEIWSRKPHYAIILSREPPHVAAMTFDQFVSKVAKEGGKRCLQMKVGLNSSSCLRMRRGSESNQDE